MSFYTWKCHNETPVIAILNTQKCICSKTKNRKVKQDLSGVGTSRRGEDIRKGYRRVNMVGILCTHVQKWKNKTC
jgi:hypothetical protein